MISTSSKKGLFPFLKKHLVSSIFIMGFAFDILILPDVDHFITIILGTSYITLFSVCLFLRELLIKNNKVDDEEKETYRLLTFLISFFSGSALSYIFTYSLRSADLAYSAPFLILFFVVLIANELISSHRFRLVFDYVLLVTASTFYNIYIMPLVTGAFDDRTFFISIFSSALIIYFYTMVFSRYSEFGDLIKPKGNALAFLLPVIVLFLALNFLLPPVPFSIQKVIVNSGKYEEGKEKTFFAKVHSFGKDQTLRIPFVGDEKLSYTTVYSLPEGVTSAPEHLWYKKGGSAFPDPIPTLAKNENTGFDVRSLTTEIKKERGEYQVLTVVGRRVIRADNVSIK